MAVFDTVNGSQSRQQSTLWRYLLLLACCAIGWFLLSQSANGDFFWLDDGTARACSSVATDSPPTESQLHDCPRLAGSEIDTYKNQLWVVGELRIPNELIEADRPIGLFLSARAASRVYLNGKFLGQNGVPGDTSQTETPGTLDASFYLPKSEINKRQNIVALLMSGQHSLWPVQPSVLSLRVGEYRVAPFHGYSDYWIALLTFGGFLIAAIYFGVLARSDDLRSSSILLCIGCVLAACQLAIEVSRGYWAYPYPLHDVRQFLICTFAFGVGLTLYWHTLIGMDNPPYRHQLLSAVTIALLGLGFLAGYDAKASWIMFVFCVAGGVTTVFSGQASKLKKLFLAFAFFSFASLIALDPGQFVDTYYYLFLMLLMSALFAYQASAYQTAEHERRASESERAKLEIALEGLKSESDAFITVNVAGSKERIDCNDISVVSAAGDYAVVRLRGGREIVQSESLKSLSQQLPGFFVTTHRSYIVNLNELAGLKRHANGGGELQLKDGHMIPVSRRVFPKIRKTFLSA
ncbi:MAG: LytTR family DNA-binding domain-containing protein [Pseudomonadota bacterium]